MEGDRADSGWIGDVLEASLDVAEERIFLRSEIVDEDIRPAVIVVIGKVDAHSGERSAVVVVGEAKAHRFFRERAVPPVAKQLLWKRIVGYRNIRPAIAIEILKGNTQALSRRGAQARSRGDVCECPVAVVVIDQVRDCLELVGVTVGTVACLSLSTPDILVEIPVQVARHDQVQKTVPVIVHEAGAGGPAAAADAGLCRHIRESAVAVVVVQNILAKVGDV